jgi:hypothetical protein
MEDKKHDAVTVLGVPEPAFRQAWIHILSRAMLKSGKGFRVDSPNRKPRKGASQWHGERRADKTEKTKLERSLAQVRTVAR